MQQLSFRGSKLGWKNLPLTSRGPVDRRIITLGQMGRIPGFIIYGISTRKTYWMKMPTHKRPMEDHLPYFL